MPSEREALLKRLDAAVAERAASLERAQPNLKAVEQFAALQQEEAKAKEALVAAQAAARAAGAEFGRVRQRRFELFHECYDHVVRVRSNILSVRSLRRVRTRAALCGFVAAHITPL